MEQCCKRKEKGKHKNYIVLTKSKISLILTNEGTAITVGGQPLPAMGGGADDYIRDFAFLLCTYQLCQSDHSDMQKELTAPPATVAVNSLT